MPIYIIKEPKKNNCCKSTKYYKKDEKVFNVSSTNSEQSKLCVNSPLYIYTRLLWKQTISSNSP